METTGRTFADFFYSASRRGLMKPNTAKSFSGPVRKVLPVAEDWETMDVSQVDAEDILARFRNLHGDELTPSSLMAYERRFKQALQIFLEYANNPTRWRFKGGGGSARKSRPERAVAQQDNGHTPAPMANPHAGGPAGGVQPKLVDYPYPLREDCVVYLRLPQGLTAAEVQRLTAYLKTLTVDFSPSES